MSTNFLSNENKGVVWQILLDHSAFSNISDKHFSNVREIFESTFIEVNKFNKINTLVDKNKLAISGIMKKLMYLKSQKITPPLQEVKIDLERAAESKQEEFIKLIQRPTPQEIDFLDENKIIDDNPISDGEMTLKLNSMMNQRQTEFNLLPNTTPTETTEVETTEVETTEVETTEAETKSNKKVSFVNEKTGFLNKIKRQDIQEDVYETGNNIEGLHESKNLENLFKIVNELLENQKLIISELNDIKMKVLHL